MNHERTLWIATLALTCATSVAAQDGRRFEREPAGPGGADGTGGWVRIDPDGERWRVDPAVITVRFLPGVADLADFQERCTAAGVARELLTGLRLVRSNILGFHDLRVPTGADVMDVLALVRATGLAQSAEENTFGEWLALPDDGLFPAQWALHNVGQTGGTPGADIHLVDAWDITTGSSSVILASADSGVEIGHPDLIQNLWKNPGEIPGNLIDDDGNGFVDDYDGWDFETMSGLVSGSKDHGTRLAGIMGASTNNGIGVAGVAGGWAGQGGCRVMPIKVGDFAPLSQVLDDAILYAAANGARVMNFSFKVASSAAIEQAIDSAHDDFHVFLTGASGNTPETVVIYPARNRKVVAVPATDHNDMQANYSVAGPENWVAAPGIVVSTVLNAQYATGGGTSYSAPHIAGVAGLLLSVMPGLTPPDIREVLRVTADDSGAPGWDPATGWGRVDAHAALLHVLDSDCNQNGLYDPGEIAVGAVLDENHDGVPDECEGLAYCTGKLNSCGELPSLHASGIASASAPSGFLIEALHARPGKLGLLFYTDKGAVTPALPFQGGFQCLQQPLSRGRDMIASGVSGGCSGSFTIDWNAFAAGTIGGAPKPFLRVPGTRVDLQCWGRDSIGSGSYLSDALRYFVWP